MGALLALVSYTLWNQPFIGVDDTSDVVPELHPLRLLLHLIPNSGVIILPNSVTMTNSSIARKGRKRGTHAAA